MPDPRWTRLDPLRLNLGCATYYKPGWLNVDALEWDGHDRVDFLRLDLRAPLPFPDASVDEAYAGHVLEHLPKPLVLVKELHRVLKPGARACLVVPSADEAWREHRAGRLPDELLETIVGRLDEGEYGHHNVWSRDALCALCWVAGFRKLTDVDPIGDPRLTGRAVWQCGVDAWR